MRGGRRVGDRSTLGRTAIVGADRRVAQDGPLGPHGEVVGYSGGQGYSPHLGPGRVFSSSQGRHSKLPRRTIVSQGTVLFISVFHTENALYLFFID